MSAIRLALRTLRPSRTFSRPITTTARRLIETSNPGNAESHPTAPGHRKIQSEKPLGPHMTNTTSTIANDMPSAGARKVPPEFLSTTEPHFVPTDAIPENTERMTGGTQDGAATQDQNSGADVASAGEMGVGEMEESKFTVEPLRRTGEDANTMRARLLCG